MSADTAPYSTPVGPCYTVPALLARDWTRGLVKHWLPTPDWRSAAGTHYWLATRVEAVEASEEWQAAQRTAIRRRDASRARWERGRAEGEAILARIAAREARRLGRDGGTK